MKKPATFDFESWLTDMPDALERLLAVVPAELLAQLDFTASSLDSIEQWLLATYSTVSSYKADSSIDIYDGCARYVGETVRRTLGGQWDLDQDKRSVFYGMPILVRAGALGTTCPHSLVTASIDRRTGRFIRTIVESHST